LRLNRVNPISMHVCMTTPGELKMGYMVFEDLQSKKFITGPRDLPVKIHRDSCRFYVDRDMQPLSDGTVHLIPLTTLKHMLDDLENRGNELNVVLSQVLNVGKSQSKAISCES